jgi:hypothetical protein
LGPEWLLARALNYTDCQTVLLLHAVLQKKRPYSPLLLTGGNRYRY